MGPANWLRLVVERIADFIDNKVGHLAVDVAGELNEPGFYAGLFRLPRQIERINRNAMAAEAGPGVERHEAEWLRCGCLDYLPDVDAHAVAHQGHLVHQPDVDHTESIFEQLHHLGNACRAYRDYGIQGLAIEERANLRTRRRDAADNLRNIPGLKSFVAGINALG